MSLDLDRLEQDLRRAADSFPVAPLPDRAWQENLRRLESARVGGARRRRQRLLAVSAAIVLVALVGGGLALSGGPSGRVPASGGDDWFAPENLLGPVVTVETLSLGGVPTKHEAALSDTTGKGPSLCDRYVSSGGSAGGCTSRDPKADDPAVAFDFLTGTSGSGNLRGVLGAVDSRVNHVQVWMANGDMTVAALEPAGWEGTRIFGLTVAASRPRPVWLAAYADASGTVLQSVNLADRFGTSWLPRGGSGCTGTATGSWPQPGTGSTGGVRVALWSASAFVTFSSPSSDSSGSTCVALKPRSLAGALDVAGHVVVVTGPAVVTVELRSSSGATVAGSSRKVSPSDRSPFQVADLPEPAPGSYRLVALDGQGQVLDQADFSPVSP